MNKEESASRSDTPRTEAMIDSCGDYEKAYQWRGRFAEFARGLERELAASRSERGTLATAVEALYFSAYWHPDRKVDEQTLWTAVRDAAGIAPGQTAERLGVDRTKHRLAHPQCSARGGCNHGHNCLVEQRCIDAAQPGERNEP